MKTMNSQEKRKYFISEIRKSDLFAGIDESFWNKISKRLELVSLNKGEILFHQGDAAGAMYMVVDGRLEVKMLDENGHEAPIGILGPYMMAGEIQAIAGGKRTASIYALSPVHLIKITKDIIDDLASREPDVFKKILNTALSRLHNDQLRLLLPKLFGSLEASELEYIKQHIEWIRLNRGQILCRQGDQGDCIYIVISGKIRAVKEEEIQKKNLGEFGRGEILGEMAVLTEGVRSATLLATRNSYLAGIPASMFERLAEVHPRAILSIGQTLAKRILKTESVPYTPDMQINLAISAISGTLPLADFTQRLLRLLENHFRTFHLSSARMRSITGISEVSTIEDDDPINVRLSAWIDEQEAKCHITLYEADSVASAWTKRCLRNADKILVLVPGDRSTADIDPEMLCLLQSDSLELTNRVLVFIHPENTLQPSGSIDWLKLLPSKAHYHFRWDRESDLQRIARFLTGKGVNLVLSGGAACGLAHIGCILALEENGVPIDSISGTSMGAVIASQYAIGMGYVDLVRSNRWIWMVSRPTKDLTLPVISFLRGRKVDQAAKMICGETRIEDLWRPFFCVSTNLTSAELVIHREGRLQNAIRASISVPGLVPPAVRGTDILVDGGIMNNLPVDIARKLFSGIFIAVDVTDAKKLSAPEARFPPPWSLIRNKIFQRKDRTHTPNIFDIIYHSAVVGSRNKTEKAKSVVDLYLRPPVECFKFLEFEAFDKIITAGYQYSKEIIGEWKQGREFYS